MVVSIPPPPPSHPIDSCQRQIGTWRQKWKVESTENQTLKKKIEELLASESKQNHDRLLSLIGQLETQVAHKEQQFALRIARNN
jgi:uncharacterized protein YueI